MPTRCCQLDLRRLKSFLAALGAAWPLSVAGQNAVTLPGITVYSPRVANQSPAGTFAMPVSALRYEPRVDLQGRNLAEGQADVTIRGGIFENTGFQLGAVTILDPQTGHYLAELPVAPSLLSAPRVVTGADLAVGATNATVGALAYEWRPVRTAGAAAVSGENNLRRAEIYRISVRRSARRFGVDVALAHSASDGGRVGRARRRPRESRVQFSGNPRRRTFRGISGQALRLAQPLHAVQLNETENSQTTPA